MNNIRKTFFILTLLTIAAWAKAQNGVNSPYSRYGFGLLADRSMGFNKAMSGVALGFRDGQEINTANPAAYSATDSLTALFDLGLTLQNGNFKMGNLTQNARNSSFDYFAYAFRVTKGLGMAVSLQPFSKINYEFSSESKTIENNVNVTNSYAYAGTGALRQIMLGAGWQIIRPLSIVQTARSVLAIGYSRLISSFQSMAGCAALMISSLDAGIQYTVNLSRKDRLTIGATYGFGHKLYGDALRKTSTISSSSEVSTEVILEDAFQLPHSFGFGVTFYSNNRIRAGVDATWERWSKVYFPTSQNYEDKEGATEWTPHTGILNDRLKFAGGFEYTPDHESASFLKRTKYKFGGYFSRSYANANETPTISLGKPIEFGVSAGFTFPIRNRNLFYSSPKINVTFSWVHTNIPYYSNLTSRSETLRENYLRLSVGLTLSERWFYKWKVQ